MFVSSERNSSDKKCLVMKQFLSADQLDEIEEIIEMKITHRKNIERRKTKFGFESTSKMGLNMPGSAVIIPDSSDGTDPENPYADGKFYQVCDVLIRETLQTLVLPLQRSRGGDLSVSFSEC